MKLTKSEFEMACAAIEQAMTKVDTLNAKLGVTLEEGESIRLMSECKFPSPASVHKKYVPIENNYWTTAFYTGLQFLCFQMSGDDTYKRVIERHLISFRRRLHQRVVLATHDLGFLFEYSSLAAWRFFGDNLAKKDALEAVDLLMERYYSNAGIIQAWGDLSDPEQCGRMIIDANMNLPLLYWATHETGNDKYYKAAYNHVKNACTYIIREDKSTYHTFHFDPITGEPLRGTTAQGFADNSCWARGQAWAIYGFALNYDYTKDPTLLIASMECADYFIAHLPKDKVCFWDLIFTDEDNQERDSSAAAIAVCGLIELAGLIGRKYPAKAEEYQRTAKQILFSLIDNYAVEYDSFDGLLVHSVYNKPENKGVDECTIWGDYYYLEALLRVIGKYEKLI